MATRHGWFFWVESAKSLNFSQIKKRKTAARFQVLRDCFTYEAFFLVATAWVLSDDGGAVALPQQHWRSSSSTRVCVEEHQHHGKDHQGRSFLHSHWSHLFSYDLLLSSRISWLVSLRLQLVSGWSVGESAWISCRMKHQCVWFQNQNLQHAIKETSSHI